MKPDTQSRFRRSRRWIGLTCLIVAGLYANDGMLRFAATRNPGTRLNYLLTTSPRADSVTVLGSSLLANAISTPQLAQAIDGSVIQLALGGQGLQEQALIWELYLSRHRCQTLVLELHEESLRIDGLPVPLREDRYAVHVNQPIVQRHLLAYSGVINVLCWQHLPMWSFAEFSHKVGWHDWVGYLKATPYDPHAPALYARSGSRLAATPRHQRRRPPATKPTAVDPAAVAALNTILVLAKDAGVRVILVYPPRFGGDARDLGERDPGERNLGERNLGERDLSLVAPSALVRTPLFYFSQLPQTDPLLFDDWRHASAAGARQFTQELANEILRPLAMP